MKRFLYLVTLCLVVGALAQIVNSVKSGKISSSPMLYAGNGSPGP